MRTMKDIAYGKLDEQKLDIYLPEGEDFPVFLYFHGGGLEHGCHDGDAEQRLGELLAANGVGCVSAGYRMYPTAVYPEFIRDAAQAAAWVRGEMAGWGGNALYVGGSSAGGYLSMMLCFDPKYLAPYGIHPADLAGFIHDAGQPTTHFNVLRERGIHSSRVIVDEAAPLYHIAPEGKYPPMHFIVSDNDMPGRYEQTLLTLSTLQQFDVPDVTCRVMHGTHCAYVGAVNEAGESVLGRLVLDCILEEKQ